MVLHAVFTSIGAHFGVLLLSLSLLALATFVGMMTSVTSCFVSTHVVRVPFSSQELDIAAAAGTACVKCGTHTTGKWYNWKDKPGTKICMSCFHKIQLDVAAAAGTTCVKCGTDTTSQWHNCKDKPGTKICRSCYGKNEGKNKKAGKANEE